MSTWVEAVLRVAAKCDCFNSSPDSSKNKAIPLFCCGVRIGQIKPSILDHLLVYDDVLTAEIVNGKVASVRLSDNLSDAGKRTMAVNGMLKDLQSKDLFPRLNGWRNEDYAVTEKFGMPALFNCERAGARLLGILVFGIHLTGYVRTEDGGYKMWIARRSLSKATYPGMLDNMVAGAIAAGTGVLETLIKESQEEASLSEELVRQAKPTGTISYFHESPDGLEPETEFLYELELPNDFIPKPEDGEVSKFFLWDIEQVKSEVAKENFKPNCALVILQFLLQHGLILPDNEPEYVRLASCAHVNIY